MLMTSIQRRLLVWLLGTLLIGALAAGAIVYREAHEEADALFDYQLRQVAESLPARAFDPVADPRPGLPEAGQGVVVQIWSMRGERLYLSHPASHLPPRAELGFSTVTTAEGDWRVFADQYHDAMIEVAQPMQVRRGIAAAIAVRTVLPLLLLLPVLGVVIWLIVGRGLRPMRRLAREVESRNPHSLEALPEGRLPDEVRPLVVALNQLLARLQQALVTQRNFVSDAAHELRTPLTALQLQVQLAERAHTVEESQTAIASLREGLTRVVRLVEQLLALARVDPNATPTPFQALELVEIARQSVVEHTALALSRHLDLGLVADQPVGVMGDGAALLTLINALVDNALRYTPTHGRVDVRVSQAPDSALLEVSDTGPGIPGNERERVFDRFFRGAGVTVPGSGLGLAIVREIARRHDATLELADASAAGGLVVRVRFAALRASRPV
jgi:two-component system OmpR family sensor kinase